MLVYPPSKKRKKQATSCVTKETNVYPQGSGCKQRLQCRGSMSNGRGHGKNLRKLTQNKYIYISGVSVEHTKNHIILRSKLSTYDFHIILLVLPFHFLSLSIFDWRTKGESTKKHESLKKKNAHLFLIFGPLCECQKTVSGR